MTVPTAPGGPGWPLSTLSLTLEYSFCSFAQISHSPIPDPPPPQSAKIWLPDTPYSPSCISHLEFLEHWISLEGENLKISATRTHTELEIKGFSAKPHKKNLGFVIFQWKYKLIGEPHSMDGGGRKEEVGAGRDGEREGEREQGGAEREREGENEVWVETSENSVWQNDWGAPELTEALADLWRPGLQVKPLQSKWVGLD